MNLLSDIDDKLNKVLIDNGLPFIESNSEADSYINMSYNDLLAISTRPKANDVSFILEQCALNTQKTCNRLQAKLIQVEHNLNIALAKVYDDYNTYGGYEIVLGKACNEYEHIRELNQLKIDIKMQLADLSYISKHITELAQRVLSMGYRHWKKD